MSNARTQLRELVVTDINEHHPDNADKAHAIVDRLLDMPQMESDDSMIMFIHAYRRAMERRDSANPNRSV